jgi:hypothetical protein
MGAQIRAPNELPFAIRHSDRVVVVKSAVKIRLRGLLVVKGFEVAGCCRRRSCAGYVSGIEA